ncbi:MAG: hypothetical protein K5650_03660 [Bacteroidales bacterium]|nr:hypothetical protein [Bacteroidales bacterium]
MANRFREKTAEPEIAAEVAAEAAEQPQQPESVASTGRGSKTARRIAGVLGGDVLKSRFVVRQIPLLLLVALYLIILVANRYKVESLSREKMELEDRLGYLREHRILMQRQYQESVKISHLAQQLESRGIGFTACPPYEVKQ